jgi:hypothetical protein
MLSKTGITGRSTADEYMSAIVAWEENGGNVESGVASDAWACGNN